MPPYIKNTLQSFLSFFLIAFSLYIFISLVSYDISDSGFFNKNSSSQINNLGGPLGASISDFLFTLIGYGGYLVLLIGCVWAIQILFYEDLYKSRNKTLVRLASSIFLLVCFCSIGDLYFQNSFGGIVGEQFLIGLSSIIGSLGSLIFLVILVIPATSLSFNFSWLKTIDHFGKIIIISGSYSLALLSKISKNFKNIIVLSFNRLRKFIAKIKDKSDLKKAEDIKSKISIEPQIKEKQIDRNTANFKQADLPIKNDTPLKEVPKQDSDEIDENKKIKTEMPSTELLDRALDDGSSLSESE